MVNPFCSDEMLTMQSQLMYLHISLLPSCFWRYGKMNPCWVDGVWYFSNVRHRNSHCYEACIVLTYWYFQFLFTVVEHLHVFSLVVSYSCFTEFSIVINYEMCINIPIFQIQVWLHVCTVTASFHDITYPF